MDRTCFETPLISGSRRRSFQKRQRPLDQRPIVTRLEPLVIREDFKNEVAFGRPGSDLLSRVLRRSTMGAGAFHGRVRKGNGCSHPAITTRSAKRNFGLNRLSGLCPAR